MAHLLGRLSIAGALAVILAGVSPRQQQPPPQRESSGQATDSKTDTPPAQEQAQPPQEGTPPPATSPATPAAGAKDPWDSPTAEDMVEELRRQRPASEIIRPNAPDTGDAAPRTAGPRTLLPEGTPIVSRAGRVVRDGIWWTLVFESDHPEHPEPPIRILPNSSLEVMARMAETIPTGLVFIVSGEVTEFEGQNYLLVRVFMRRQESGNLTK